MSYNKMVDYHGKYISALVLKEINELKDIIIKQNDVMFKIHVDNTTLLNELITTKNRSENISNEIIRFPVNTKEDLELLEKDVTEDADRFIPTVRSLLQPGGMQKNLFKVIGNNVLIQYNYDGIRGKDAFKDYKRINDMMFQAVRHEGFTEADYVYEIKRGFKAAKNRYFKNISMNKKKNLNKDSIIIN